MLECERYRSDTLVLSRFVKWSECNGVNRRYRVRVPHCNDLLITSVTVDLIWLLLFEMRSRYNTVCMFVGRR